MHLAPVGVAVEAPRHEVAAPALVVQAASCHLDSRRPRHPRVRVLDAAEAERVSQFPVAVVRDAVELENPVLEAGRRVHLAGPELAGCRVPSEHRLRAGPASRSSDAQDVLEGRLFVVAAEAPRQAGALVEDAVGEVDEFRDLDGDAPPPSPHRRAELEGAHTPGANVAESVHRAERLGAAAGLGQPHIDESVPETLEIAGIFGIVSTALPGHALAELDAAIEEEIAAFLKEGPSGEELDRMVTSRRAAFIRGIERVGGFGGKSDQLARNETYMDDPAFYKATLARWDEARPVHLQAVAGNWMTRGQFILEVLPFPQASVSEAKADRTRLPDTGSPPMASFDRFERFQLDNGLKVVLAERSAVPVVELNLVIDAGFAADQFATPGTANLALAMLDEGTATRSSLEISDELLRLGATLGAGSDLDTSFVSMSALKENLDTSLDLYADVILDPSFPERDFARLQQLQIVGIQQEKVRPRTLALRLFPRILYGDGHAYSLPFTGSGDEAAVAALTPEGLAAFHDAWFKPGNSTLVVVGDINRSEIEPLLTARFDRWRPGDVPNKNLATVAHQTESIVYLVDRPDSEQSVIIAGHIAPPRNNDAELAIAAMNQVLGGDFTARVNMNLREDKNWSYGAFTQLVPAKGQRPFIAVAPVQTDKTSEAMAELKREIEEIRSVRPATADEIAKVKDRRTLSLPGRWETASAVLGSIVEIVRFGLPDDYWDTYADAVRALSEEEIHQAAVDVVYPEGLIWVVVGDRTRIEAGIRELDIGRIVPLDADGNVLADRVDTGTGVVLE